ncbi:hypothetical protein TeGR_g1201 [Tetraparma gracilis]|uniref:Sulfotransferase n=1 Tax=Tetraparma gracilis TaxID=2962635 RepID=A0ABQ6N7L7_9STRA|nr:hypothetical protein TeGR_g1201 [Tetraparma gracilis]
MSPFPPLLASPLVLFLAALAAHRLVHNPDPFTLPLPPATAAWIRLRALLSPGASKFPLKNRMFLLLRAAIYLLGSVSWLVLWSLDDLIFFAYRSTPLTNPIFLVGGFRTGSTSLHRALSLDEKKYVSPRFVELALPFLSVHFFLDFLEWLDGRFGTSCIKRIEAKFHQIIGPEAMARHPMHYYEAEEDDILHAAWHLSGWYIGTMFPDADAWVASGQMGKYPPAEREKCFKFYERALQKVLWRRGNGRTLLSKSHLIEFMFTLEEKIPSATFVGTVRNPKDTFVSWYGLAQAASKVMGGGWCLATKDAVDVHLRFWDLFSEAEMKFWGDEKKNKILVPFNDYIKDQDATVRKIYKGMDVKVEADFEKALRDDAERHANYKEKRAYKNDTLEELGTSGDAVEKRMRRYIDFFKL